MKKLLFILLVCQSVFISCEKEHEKEFPCPVVTADEVPTIVKSSFQSMYSKASVEKWFNKDNSHFVAYFLTNSVKTLVYYKRDGTFEKEEIKGQKGNHHNDDDDEDGCECEVDK